MQKVIAISYSDVGKSWGPAIHFLEVWNAIYNKEIFCVEAFACCDKERPYVDSPCIKKLFKTGNSSLGRVTSKILFDIYLFIYLLRIQRTVVYIRWAQYCILTAYACKIKKHFVVYELNGLNREDCKSAGSSIFRRLHYYAAEYACFHGGNARIVAVSKAIEASVVSEHSVASSITISNGCKSTLNSMAKTSVNQNCFVLAYVGTFTSWDGHLLLPKVASAFRELQIPIQVKLAGPGFERSRIYDESTALGCFSYMGNVEYSRLDEFYSSSDAGVALYEYERHKTVEISSLKLLEYRACRLPILTTAVPGTEFVDENAIGLRLTPQELNDPQLLKNRLGEFYSKRSSYEKAYERCAPARTWDDVAQDTIGYISSILA